ncbi:Cell wall assembly regulator, partial [Rhizina undulata]
MTSNDRHANHDSPYRTTGPNQHIGVGRNPALQSVAASGGMGTYHDDPASRSTTALATSAGGYSPRSPPNGTTNSPTSPYSPGMRSAAVNGDPPGGGIALQDFGADGMPPPPPVAHSWTRIDKWTEDNYPELFDQLCVPATVNDVNELEFSLDCSLPIDVRESLQVHDGQERGGTPTGIIFSAMLLDCEEILDEWKNWRVVEQEYLAPQALPGAPGSAGPSKRNSQIIAKSGLLEKQGSHPEGAVQKAYAHPGWIPLARDWGGNNIAVDLAPGPNGTW